MKNELFSISKIFTERLLRIPDYQRGYAWTEKQLKEFWADVSQLDIGKNHYVGVLTLEDVSDLDNKWWSDDLWIIESKCYEAHYIVDGQQRLTTIIVLIQSILEHCKELDLNYTTPDEIRKKFIYESKDGGISRSYLFGYVVDNPSYEFLKQKIFCEPSEDSYSIQETIYTNNLIFAKNFFNEKLSNMAFEDIEILYKKITQNLLFNLYSMSDEIDVHVSFETMNNRGKPLSHLELLKNRLIYLSTQFDTDLHERTKLRKAINDCWKAIYHQLGRNKENPLDDDVFLSNHFILFFGDQYYPEQQFKFRYGRAPHAEYQDFLLEEKFTIKSIHQSEGNPLTLSDLYSYVASLKSSVEKWYEISNPEDSKLPQEVVFWLQKIIRIKAPISFPLIMVVLQKYSDDKLLINFLKSTERLLFLNVLASKSYYLSMDPEIFIQLATDLSNNKTNVEKVIATIDEYSASFTREKSILNSISESLKDGGFYRWRGLRYFLFEYELHLQEKSKTYSPKMNWEDFRRDNRDHHTVEHIYPQNPRKPEWTKLYSKYTAKQRTTLRHTLGNLVPLSKPKNSSFQNKPFLDKVGNVKNTIGFKYGSFSEIELTDNKQWSATEILNRSIILLKFLEKRWNIKFDDIDHMVDFLHLDFIIDKESLVLSNKKFIPKN